MKTMHLVSGLALVVASLGPHGAVPEPSPHAYRGEVQLTVDAGTLTVPSGGGQPSLTINSTTKVVVTSTPDPTEPSNGRVRATFTPMPVAALPGSDGVSNGPAIADGAPLAAAPSLVKSAAVAGLGPAQVTAAGSTAGSPGVGAADEETANERAVDAAAAALNGVSGQAAAMTAVTSVLAPSSDTGASLPSTQIPVIVVHGITSDSLVMLPVVAELQAQGINTYAFTYGQYPSLAGLFLGGVAPIDQSVQELAAEVAKVEQETGSSKVNLVGGSEGGLIIRAYMASDTGNNVANVVEYSGAHNGTTLDGLSSLVNGLPTPIRTALFKVVDLVLGPAGPQLLAGSSFMNNLNETPATKPGVNYLEFSTTGDFVVTPYTSSFLTAGPGSTVVNVEAHSIPGALPVLKDFHSLTLLDPATNVMVADFLKASDANPPTAEQIANNPGTTITVDSGTVTVAQGDKPATVITGVTVPPKSLSSLIQDYFGQSEDSAAQNAKGPAAKDISAPESAAVVSAANAPASGKSTASTISGTEPSAAKPEADAADNAASTRVKSVQPKPKVGGPVDGTTASSAGSASSSETSTAGRGTGKPATAGGTTGSVAKPDPSAKSAAKPKAGSAGDATRGSFGPAAKSGPATSPQPSHHEPRRSDHVK